MSGRIPPDLIDEIIFKNPIVDVISSYVNLKKNGSRYTGLCPFHSEKTPSFVVYPNNQSFYCFGCGTGGTVITFLSKIENLTYRETLQMLADRAGITLPSNSYEREDPNIPSKKRVQEMNLAAAKFFRACLFDPRIGARGMQYLAVKRGLSESTIKHFGLGYAPDSFDALKRHMLSLGYKEEELNHAFLIGKSQKGNYYDIYRDRVIFPVISTTGEIIGFGGRTLKEDNEEGRKYINTSDTPAFKKSRNLYALNFAKNVKSTADEMILCEGYMDVIALHAAGFENAVATLGTALTEEQARIMAKYTKRIVISYDMDEAGRKAAAKAIRILSEVGLEVKLLRMPGVKGSPDYAKDPDEFIKKFGRVRFERLLKDSVPDFDYRRDVVLSKYDISSADAKIRAANELTTIISEYQSGIARELYIGDISKRLELPRETLKAEVEKKRSYLNRKAQDDLKREADRSVMMIGDRVNPEASKKPAAVKAEEVILGILMHSEDARAYLLKNPESLTDDDFFSEFSRELFRRIVELSKSDHGFSVPVLEEGYTAEEFSRVYSILKRREDLGENGVAVMLDAIKKLKAETDDNTDPIAAARRRIGLSEAQ